MGHIKPVVQLLYVGMGVSSNLVTDAIMIYKVILFLQALVCSLFAPFIDDTDRHGECDFELYSLFTGFCKKNVLLLKFPRQTGQSMHSLSAKTENLQK